MSNKEDLDESLEPFDTSYFDDDMTGTLEDNLATLRKGQGLLACFLKHIQKLVTVVKLYT